MRKCLVFRRGAFNEVFNGEKLEIERLPSFSKLLLAFVILNVTTACLLILLSIIFNRVGLKWEKLGRGRRGETFDKSQKMQMTVIFKNFVPFEKRQKNAFIIFLNMCLLEFPSLFLNSTAAANPQLSELQWIYEMAREECFSSHSLSTWTPMKCGWNDTCKTQEDPASSFRKLRKFKVNKISKAPPPNQLLSLVSLSSKKC